MTNAARINGTAVHADAGSPRKHPELIHLVAGMLGRAHKKAEDAGDPDQARAILHLAHSFADEFELSSEEFGRMCFVHAATNAP